MVYVPDASRAVGVATKLLSTDPARRLHGRDRRRIRSRARRARRPKGHAGVAGRSPRQPFHDWNQPFPPNPSPASARPAHASTRAWPTSSAAHRLDPSSRPGIWPVVPGHPRRTRRSGETARQLFADGRRCSARSSWRKLAVGPRRLRPLSGRQRTRTSSSTPTRADHRTDRWVGPAPAAQTAGRPFQLGARRLIGRKRLRRCLRRHRRPGHRRARRRVRGRPRRLPAIMLKSLADRLAEAAAEWLHLQIRTEYWGYAPTSL